MAKYLSIVFGMLLHAAGFSQSCEWTLKGRITDENSVEALEGATVTLVHLQQSTVTDERGRFEFRQLCAGAYQLAVSHVGCATLVLPITLTRDTLLKIKLNHQEAELNEVQITAARRESHATQSAVTISAEKLSALRGLSLGETLEKVPGVYALRTGATISKPVIHGLYGTRIVILNNGVRLESQQWGSEHAPEIDPFLAQRITVIKGANSLRYGSDALGGVILVEPNPLPTRHGVAGEWNTALFSNNAETNVSATVEGCHHRVSALSWRVNGTYKRGGNSRAADYWLQNTGLQEGNFSVAAGYKKPRAGAEVFYARFETRLGILRAAHSGNLNDLQRAIARTQPADDAAFSYAIARPFQSVVHHLAKVRAYVQTRQLGSLSLTLAFQNNVRKEYDIAGAAVQDKTRPGFYFQIQTLQLDAVWEHRVSEVLSGAVGWSVSTQTNNFKYAYFIPDFRNVGTGLFAVERWIKGDWEVEAGLRMDYKWGQYYVRTTLQQYDTMLHFYAPSGNLGFEHHAHPHLTWRMNVGSAFRAPAPNELFAFGVHHGAATFETGNRYLKPEQSLNWTASLDYDLPFLTLRAEVYTNYVLRFINLVPVQPARLTIRGAFPSFEYRQQNAWLSGADIDLALHPQKGLDFFNKTSLLFARNTATRDWLEQMPPIRFENGVRYTATLSKRVKEVFAGASILNVLKQTFMPRSTNDYAPPPPAYWLLNLEAGLRWQSDIHSVSLSITVENAANFRYRDYLDRFRYYADARGIQGALRLQWSFFAPEH
ncbi:MAG: TonB-dependent receptor [Bacteroidetes bacterium]|nr:TonB-dependent receptor [Bacteroidota bacterium]